MQLRLLLFPTLKVLKGAEIDKWMDATGHIVLRVMRGQIILKGRTRRRKLAIAHRAG